MISQILGFIQHHLLSMSALAKFALALVLLVAVPRLCRRLHVPPAVGLLLSGVVVGPHVIGIFGTDHPIADFFAELGKLLLMFFAGLEIDLDLFRRARNRSIAFGLTTTAVPSALGSAVGYACGYTTVPAIVIGSLLASHTLPALPIISEYGLQRREPITVAVGATVMSDTLSLAEIVGYVVLVLFGLSRIGAYVLGRLEHEEDAYFIVMLCFMIVSGVLADAIQLPGIVGAFLAGLAVNASARDKPASAKLEFLGKSLFIPIFFVVTGFLIDPAAFVGDIVNNFPLVVGIITALLVGKAIAAWAAGRAFGYSRDETLTVWSLTLPQVAATLAAALVAYDTRDAAGQRLLDGHVLNAVLVLMLTTSILGPVLTDIFAPRLVAGRGNLNPAVVHGAQ